MTSPALKERRLQAAVRDQKIKLYLMTAGEPCADIAQGVGATLAIMAYAGAHDPKVGRTNPLVGIAEEGLATCHQLVASNCWNPEFAAPLDRALDAAKKLNGLVRNKYVLAACNEIFT